MCASGNENVIHTNISCVPQARFPLWNGCSFSWQILSACTVQSVVKVRVSDFRESGTRRPQSGPAPDAVSFHSVKQYEQVIPRTVRENTHRAYALLYYHSQSYIYDLCIKSLTPVVTAFSCLQL